jgi:hypothetical protein
MKSAAATIQDKATARHFVALAALYFVAAFALAVCNASCAGVNDAALVAFVPATVDTLNVTEPYVLGCFKDRLAECKQPEEGETETECIDREVEEVRPVRFGLEGVRLAFCSTFPQLCGTEPAPDPSEIQ